MWCSRRPPPAYRSSPRASAVSRKFLGRSRPTWGNGRPEREWDAFMSEFNVRGMLTAAPAAPSPALPLGGRPAELSPAARLVAAQPIAAAYSPIVVAGFVRMIEFALLAAIGD